MTLQRIAIQNLLRRKGKALTILVGLVLGIGTVVTVIGFADALTGDINHQLEKYGANILIVPRTESLPLSYGGIQMGGVSFDMQELRETDLEAVQNIQYARNIAALGPLALGAVTVRGQAVMLAGVDFRETRILKPWWRIEGAAPGAEEVLAGAEAARVLGLAVGDALTLRDRAMRVSGILGPTGAQDDHLLFTPLATAQAVLDMPGRVSMAEVAALCTACPVEEMVAQIGAALPGAKVMAIQQVVKGRMETLAQFKKLSLGISIIIVAIGSMVVLVTMTGSVRERKEEIGIFRAIGFRKRHVMQIVLLEAALIALAAGLVGYPASMGATRLALMVFADHHHAAVPWNLPLAAAALGMSLAVGLAAAVYPALTAARMDPNDALRAL